MVMQNLFIILKKGEHFNQMDNDLVVKMEINGNMMEIDVNPLGIEPPTSAYLAQRHTVELAMH